MKLKNPKLYKVILGPIVEGDEALNIDSKNVIAETGVDAIKRVRLRKNEFIHEVHFISNIDK